MGAALEFDGRVTVQTAAGDELVFEGAGTHLVVDAPSLRSLAALRHAATAPPVRWAMQRMASSQAMPEVQFRVCGRTVAVMSGRGVPDLFARLLRLGPTRIKPLALIQATLRLHSRE